mgnify:CR=1 FL=1
MDKEYIKGLVQKILNKEFANINKRKIVDYVDRFNIACPYCGDSKNVYKKRGNLYFNKLFYICFNCDKKVHRFLNASWQPHVDYLFVRNHNTNVP